MTAIPVDLLQGEWSCQREIDLLTRTQTAHQELSSRLQSMTRELRGERYYPLQVETKQLRVRVYHTYVPPNSLNVDGLEITRTGSTAHTVKIKLLPPQTPERFTISPELEAAIGHNIGPAKAYTKQDIVLAIWEYIKLRNLIKEDDCRVVICDKRMVQMLKCVSLPFTSIIVALKQHLTPISTIDLEYTLNLSAACESELLEEQFFDVSVAATSERDRTRARALKEIEELQQDQERRLHC
ncbi:unnamed protein product [Peronospora farinosa]|uniref:DM2 domain-containing protein n=1 Tax=Peronospora farinosa TaxID=134698 RepID=A0ABN8C1V0_9STRA|nr:unnamed protein product [Peronospora farinosa]